MDFIEINFNSWNYKFYWKPRLWSDIINIKIYDFCIYSICKSNIFEKYIH